MSEANKLSSECLNCLKPLCKDGCPCENEINQIIHFIKNDDFKNAAKTLYETNKFPEYTSILCDCGKQCQGHCIKRYKGEPVQIQKIEKYIAENSRYKIKTAPRNGKRIAIIGAGIASLSASLNLIEAGFAVDIYEKSNFIGGAIYSGIPDFRFDKSNLSKTTDDLTKAGVKFFMNHPIDSSSEFSRIANDYDRVLIAIGAQKESLGGFGANEGFYGGLTFLEDINVNKNQNKYKKFKKALVWGGGNVALDCARALKRIIDDVSIVYRRSEIEMPASKIEIGHAKSENINFRFLENIKNLILDEDKKVIGAELVNMQLGEKDESGRASFSEIDNSSHNIDCDLIICCIGQKVDLSVFGVKLNETDSHSTNIDNIYIAGDCRLNPKTIPHCIKDGRDAAIKIIDSFGELR